MSRKLSVLESGVLTEEDATKFSQFIWRMVERINEDEENGKEVLGSKDNTDMLPDLSYEITKYMREIGFYYIWEKVSDSET